MKSKSEIPLSELAFSAGGSVTLTHGDAELTLESSNDQLSVMSDFNITRDAAGLALALDVVDVLLGAIATMKADKKAGSLPDVLTVNKPTVRNNPLA